MQKDPPLSLAELRGVLSAATDYSEALWLAVFVCTGAKLNEVLNMRIDHVRSAPEEIGGRPFKTMRLLCQHLQHYASEIRPLMKSPRPDLEELGGDYLWLSSYARSPLTRTTVAQTLDRIGLALGLNLTTVRFRTTRLAYKWHELGHANPAALRRFAGLSSHFEIVQRAEEGILARPEIFPDVMPGWEDRLVQECLPAIPGSRLD